MPVKLKDFLLALGGSVAALIVISLLVVPPALEQASRTAHKTQQAYRKHAIKAWTTLPPYKAYIIKVGAPDSDGYVEVLVRYRVDIPPRAAAYVNDSLVVPVKPYVVAGGLALIFRPDPYHPMTRKEFGPGSFYFADFHDPQDGPHVMFPETRNPTIVEVAAAIFKQSASSWSMHVAALLAVLAGPIATIVLGIQLAHSRAP